MADQVLTDLTEDTALSAGDVAYFVVDPATTPLDRKVKIETILKALGTAGIGCPDAVRINNTTEGKTASLNILSAQQAVTLSGATTDSTINIPTNALLLGAAFCVNTAVTFGGGGATWSADFQDGGGVVQALVSGQAATQNTKVEKLFAPVLTDATTNVRFTPNAGTFSAGVIELVAWYLTITALASA